MNNSNRSLARKQKDRTFDGQFLFGVKTTRIFCRPSCPSPVAKEENVVYFDKMTDALKEGYRPCLRCRPDIHVEFYNGNVDGTLLVDKAISKIWDGYLAEHTVEGLATHLGISSRQLNRLFKENIGLSPIQVAKQQKALFAKKLLMYSDMSITEVAFASGFGSIRQFNDVFKGLFKMTPSAMRKNETIVKTGDSGFNIRIPYEQPFDYDKIIAFMAHRAVDGLELFTEGKYYRTFRIDNSRGHFSVEHLKEHSAILLSVTANNMNANRILYNRVRKMFDLDNNIVRISAHLKDDKRLERGMEDGIVPRLPVAFNTFEFMIRAILGQQITVKAATTLAGRVAKKADILYEKSQIEGLTHFFPNLDELMTMDLSGIGVTKTRQQTIHNVLDALKNEVFNLDRHQRYEDFRNAFIGIKGIGEWTTEYIAMRGFGMVDSFPAMDLGVIKALTSNGEKLSRKDILAMAASWEPYRAYAALALWHSLGIKDGE